MSMIAIVESKKPNMTKLEVQISECIFKNTAEVIHMPITNLARKCGVSDATIVRFVRKLGYKGYNDFKVALAQEISQNDKIESIMVAGDISREDSIETIAQKCYEVNINSLQHTISLMNYDEIEKSARIIMAAKKIHFLGIGYSGITAQDAKYNYMRIGINSDAYTDGHTMIMMCSIVDKSDVVFAISHSGDTIEIVNSLKIAKENGAKIVCVSSNGNSKIAQYADSIITYVSAETKFQTGSIPTKIAQYFVLELIYTQVVRNSIDSGAIDKKIKTAKALEFLLK
jgi:DNA-binding MurR/RpiR family transcriptional regulator